MTRATAVLSFSGVGNSDHAASNSGACVSYRLAPVIGLGVNDDRSAHNRVFGAGDGDVLDRYLVMRLALVIRLNVS